MKVGVIEHFDSMHLLPGHPKCGVPHGHTYRVEVTAEGPLVNGMVMDFDHLKKALREIMKVFDHKDLNLLLPMPSCEHISQEILKRLKEKISQRLTIRVWEGEGKWAECGE
jgi:6-pyruvoyltetrahydropterin/6-carboxytetrahydropterin synthase